jgi:hypothetical protein
MMSTTHDATLRAGAWVAPEPAELPDLRIEMAERVLQDHSEFCIRIANGDGPLVPSAPGPPMETAVSSGLILARSEHERLRQASLYWVDEDMTSLTLAAAATPTNELVRARRMPAEAGLMVFAQPIGGHDIELSALLTGAWTTAVPNLDHELQVSFPVVAVSWSHWCPADLQSNDPSDTIRWRPRTPQGAVPLRGDVEGIWLTFWTTGTKNWERFPPDQPLAIDKQTGKTITAADLATRETVRKVPRLRSHGAVLLRFGQPLPQSDPDDASQWVHVVYTSWQLMGQAGSAQLTETEVVPRRRHGLRRDERAHIVGPGAVQLVRVHTRHRPSAEASAEDTATSDGRRAPQWTRRWPVRPYRRNTCLNSHAHAAGGCEHEERIVPAHTKGPADKPLITSNRVHIWDTPPPSTTAE